jgi:hypothetical protein
MAVAIYMRMQWSRMQKYNLSKSQPESKANNRTTSPRKHLFNSTRGRVHITQLKDFMQTCGASIG